MPIVVNKYQKMANNDKCLVRVAYIEIARYDGNYRSILQRVACGIWRSIDYVGEERQTVEGYTRNQRARSAPMSVESVQVMSRWAGPPAIN